MIRVGWRLQRTETAIAVALLALAAGVLVPTGLEMASAYSRDGLSACTSGALSPACGESVRSFTARFESLGNILGWFTLVPGLIGVTLAAPLLLDLESGTYRLVWTQSLGRRRLIAGKLGLAVASALVATLALTALITWWRAPLAHLNGRLDSATFDSEGTVAFGYTLFALGLALATGVLWRRVAAAVLVAFAGYVAVRVFVDTWLRQRLTSAASATWSVRSRGPDLSHAWVLSQYPSNSAGGAVPVKLGSCEGASKHLALPVPHGARCIFAHASGYTHAVYIPAGRFWTLQAIETGLFGGLALLLVCSAAWWLHERAS